MESHEWYPNECCHDGDCIHAAKGDVIKTPNGYLVKSGQRNKNGYVLKKDHLLRWGDARIRAFPLSDGTKTSEYGYHPCFTTSQVLCLFVVPRAGV